MAMSDDGLAIDPVEDVDTGSVHSKPEEGVAILLMWVNGIAIRQALGVHPAAMTKSFLSCHGVLNSWTPASKN